VVNISKIAPTTKILRKLYKKCGKKPALAVFTKK
jgi:hypothetical protein